MAFVVFAFGFGLLLAGLAGAYFSLDLLPTGIGVLYAIGGAVAACMAVVTFALGILIRRIDALTRLMGSPRPGAEVAAQTAAADHVALSATADMRPAVERAQPPAVTHHVAPAQEEEPINENRSGHLPTLSEIEHALETPEAPPSVIGRYSSGGASYMIFDDGSIEAAMEEGTFRFASMGDFRTYLADRSEEQPQ
jgi:hypothetical protein